MLITVDLAVSDRRDAEMIENLNAASGAASATTGRGRVTLVSLPRRRAYFNLSRASPVKRDPPRGPAGRRRAGIIRTRVRVTTFP